MLCSMVIKIISMCFRIFLPSFRRIWLSSDDFAQNYRLSKRVTNMNPGHVKGVHDVNEVAIFWLMNFAFREIHFLSKYSPPKKQWIACTDVFLVCTHPYPVPDHIINNVSSLSLSRGSLINVNIFSVTFGFDPRPVSYRIKSTLSSNPLHHFKQLRD